MSSKGVKSRLVILGLSSVLRLTHRQSKIPANLPDIVAEGIKAYWENGSMAGFCNAIGERIGKLVEKSNWATEPLLTAEPENTSNYNAFLVALYQEIFSFFEFAQIQTTLYLGLVQAGSDHVNVIFTEEPCTISFKDVGGARSEMYLIPIRKAEDE